MKERRLRSISLQEPTYKIDDKLIEQKLILGLPISYLPLVPS